MAEKSRTSRRAARMAARLLRDSGAPRWQRSVASAILEDAVDRRRQCRRQRRRDDDESDDGESED